MSATDREAPPDLTATEVLRRLVTGNRRFAAGGLENPGRSPEHRIALAYGQNPVVTVLGCSDSRVPVEVVLDQGLGDVFAVRTAGQVIDPVVTGSVEFGVLNLTTSLVLVMAHDSCGALAAARDVASGAAPMPYGSVGSLVATILAPFDEVPDDPHVMARAHAAHTLRTLLGSSPALRREVASGRCAVAGATYNLQHGLLRYVTHEGDLDTTCFDDV